jgi:dipeptidyl aminopeptidase/acylaminoacyl peptidase
MKFPTPLVAWLGLLLATAQADDVRSEMERADRFGREIGNLLVNNEVRPYWPTQGSQFAYRVNPAHDRHEFLQVNLQTGEKQPAFDHAALAKALAAAAGKEVRAENLPLDDLQIPPNGGPFRFRAFGKGWSFNAANATVAADDTPPTPTPLMPPNTAMRGTHDNGPATSLTIENTLGEEIEVFWVKRGGERQSYGKVAAGQSTTMGTYAGHVWLFTAANGDPLCGITATAAPTVARITGKVAPDPSHRRNRQPDQGSDRSPDGTWQAVIRNHNLAVIPSAGGEPIALTTDGTAADGYGGSFQWSPDSKKLIAWRAKEVEIRKIHLVQSSPPDQVQPKLLTIDYPKPGDPIRQPKPRLFDLTKKQELPVADTLFDNPWDISHSAWAPDSTEFTFVYNQRGHQVVRLIGIRGDTGAARTILEERSQTFIDYSQKLYLHRLPESRSLIWASERSGYNHLYGVNEVSGQITPITKGEWNVREVVRIDAEQHRLLLKINGQPGSDPYHEHFAWVNFDGTHFTRLTASDGTHRIEFSPDEKWLIDTWSRVDQPPVVELRRANDGTLVTELARADDTALRQQGWQCPERFVAKGRDGQTDIYGVIVRPSKFYPAKKYPVLESIYAGPHDFFVPKAFSTSSNKTGMAELGFIVVSIDGMGTNWRNKKFHDVCWKNLADSGFPDRVAWIKAAAATRPEFDLTRVGLFGGSAGGQSTLAGLLHHGDFYKAGVADCGCHDNRMDKIWWNEQWMGWPVGAHYAEQSNVTLAPRLQGKLLLMVGEMDKNVDPASTMQVVNALIKAGKDFEFLVVPGAGHGVAGTPYGRHRLREFFTRHFLGH